METKHIDDKTLDISTYRGNSMSLSFSLTDKDNGADIFENTYFDFLILEDYDKEPVIKKTNQVFENCAYLELSPEETELLSFDGKYYGKYYWKLVLHKNEGYRNTIVPRDFEEKPEFRVYPGFEVCSEWN